MSLPSTQHEALANLDPLLQPFEDINDNPTYSDQRSSFFYTPANVIIENNNSNKQSTLLPRILHYLERFSGIFYSLIASLLFTCSNFIIQQLDVVLLDVFLVRFVIQGFFSFGYILYKGYHPFSSNYHNLLILIRSIIAAMGSICFYLGLDLLPLPDLITIRYTQVVWTAILSSIIFRERLTLPTIVASISTLLGVVCVAQPSFLFTKSNITNGTLSIPMNNNSKQHISGMFIAMLCAISISLGIILMKKLLEYKVRESIMMFYFILTTFSLLLIKQIHFWIFSKTNHRKFHIPTIYLTKHFIAATSLATLQLIPMVLTQKAIKREHPSIVTVVQATDIIFALILKNIFLTEKSNRLALIGSTLVLISIFILGGHKFWLDRRNRIRLSTKIEETN
ncbi:hypothetical protein I4U23_028500 [Adineta vaga]|nr:hypothetical protein I4U23_028500 [Adineta vaga]